MKIHRGMQAISSAVIWIALAGVCAAQKADVMGAHVNYGRGCRACHAWHSTARMSKVSKVRNASPEIPALWGAVTTAAENGTSANPGGVAKAISAPTPEETGLLVCFSCHDGNYAHQAMMKSETYESLPEIYGTFDDVPTMVDKPAVTTGHEFSDHPVGLKAQIGCGSTLNWSCPQDNSTMSMGDLRSARFSASYGFFIQLRGYHDTAVVVCTTCHNPHSMTVVNVPKKSASTLFPAGTYATRYFLRAPYNQAVTPESSNQEAQFCRQCHADKSNEMNNGKARSVL